MKFFSGLLKRIGRFFYDERYDEELSAIDERIEAEEKRNARMRGGHVRMRHQ